MWIASCVVSIKEVSLHEQIHKKQKTTPSDIPSEPLSKQSAETVQSTAKTTTYCSSETKRTTVYYYQELEWMELHDVDTERLVIPPISSIKSDTPIIENSDAIWSEE